IWRPRRMMQYEQAVTRARTLVKRSEEDQWELAELTWEQVEPQGTHSQRQWAGDVGVDQTYVSRLFRLWEEHREDDLLSRPRFNEAYKEVAPHSTYQSKLERGARQALADPQAVRQAVTENPEVRQAVVDRLAQDPEIATELIKASHRH